MKNFLIGVLIIAAVGGGVWWYAKKAEPVTPVPPPAPAPQQTAKTYTNDTYGISFRYSDGYSLEEKNLGNEERSHFAIILTEKTNSPPPENGEGPTAITIDMYQNNIDKLTLLKWLKNTNNSNFKLSDGTYASTTINGAEAIEYQWDGLYRADNIAFIHKDHIFSVAVTYLTPDDQIRKDFQPILGSIQLK